MEKSGSEHLAGENCCCVPRGARKWRDNCNNRPFGYVVGLTLKIWLRVTMRKDQKIRPCFWQNWCLLTRYQWGSEYISTWVNVKKRIESVWIANAFDSLCGAPWSVSKSHPSVFRSVFGNFFKHEIGLPSSCGKRAIVVCVCECVCVCACIYVRTYKGKCSYVRCVRLFFTQRGELMNFFLPQGKLMMNFFLVRSVIQILLFAKPTVGCFTP